MEGIFDLKGYPSKSSDVVALLVLNHQTQMLNHLTRVGWEARVAAAEPSADANARVDRSRRGSGQLHAVPGRGVARRPGEGASRATPSGSPRRALATARAGRCASSISRRRLFKYPCSYLIYSEAFDKLPPNAKRAVYERLWALLSGKAAPARGQRAIAPADRQAIVEILRETKPDLPEFFR